MHQLAGQLHAGQNHAPVFFGIKIIGLNNRLIIRIRCPGMDKTTRFRPLLPGRTGKARFCVNFGLDPFFIAGRGKGQLQVMIAYGGVRMPETINQGRPQPQNGRPAKQIFADLTQQFRAAGQLINGRGIFGPAGKARGIMITQILAHTGQMMHHIKAKGAQMIAIADTG